MTRADIRKQIDLLEALDGVISAADDVGSVEFEPGEPQLLNLNVYSAGSEQAVSFVRGLPPEVVAAGMRAMEEALRRMTAMQEQPA